jgi:hypothetical protein
MLIVEPRRAVLCLLYQELRSIDSVDCACDALGILAYWFGPSWFSLGEALSTTIEAQAKARQSST